MAFLCRSRALTISVLTIRTHRERRPLTLEIFAALKDATEAAYWPTMPWRRQMAPCGVVVKAELKAVDRGVIFGSFLQCLCRTKSNTTAPYPALPLTIALI
jgi:hypothetical protein